VTDSRPDSRRRPYVPVGSHPIDTGRYWLASDPINALLGQVHQWLAARAPGATVTGDPRLGKTRAIGYLARTLVDDRTGTVFPVFTVSGRDKRTASESVFYEDLLLDLGHGFVKGTLPQKRERVVTFLTECVATTPARNRALLVIDEAQLLHEAQYRWLLDIYNALDRAGVALTVLLVGQSQLLDQRTAFYEGGQRQLIGRFMVHTFRFPGLQSAHAIRTCRVGYDTDSDHPPGSGWSYTRYFFPEAYARLPARGGPPQTSGTFWARSAASTRCRGR